MPRTLATAFLALSGLLLASCAVLPFNASDNKRLVPPAEPAPLPDGRTPLDVASLAVPWKLSPECRRAAPEPCGSSAADPNFVAVAISGGGSRAAVFSAAALFRLKAWGLLDAVDVISSVSGGSFTAAYYAASCDAGETCVPTAAGSDRLRWTPGDVYEHLESNYLGTFYVPPVKAKNSSVMSIGCELAYVEGDPLPRALEP